jgi:hypothetical protein
MNRQQKHFIKNNCRKSRGPLLNFLGVLSILLFLILSYFHNESFSFIVFFVEKFISRDHHLELGAIPLLKGSFFYFKLFFLLLSIIFLTPILSFFNHLISNCINTN